MSEKIPGVINGNVASKAFSHRPWQRQIVNYTGHFDAVKSRQFGLSSEDVSAMMREAVIKSRQLGLSSEDVSAMMREYEKKANNEDAKELL